MLVAFLKWLFEMMKPSTRRFTIGEPADEESELTVHSNASTPIIVVDEHTSDAPKHATPDNQLEKSVCANCNNNNNVDFRCNSSQMNLSSTQRTDLSLLSPSQAQRTIK
uniref:Uncharacterized protein n=3 Tax=Bactrocera latifrons TaxID=174628 RepID=A0A0K8UI72_BACLA